MIENGSRAMNGWNRQWLVSGVLLAFIAAVVTLGVLYRDALSVEWVRQQLDQFGAWAPVVFMLTHYVAATLPCMIPGALAYV
ncbi:MULTISPECIES: hypothetical protein [unclassified Ectothiorhodospira]|uniref:hypothetical protein n=1 Tax=unclassified Ectothiorhodospira TaxID=2684909 RepID=UPI001EE901C2|nr:MULTISPECIES: hypothetical protein [unclassified Ectothiorhodospira]MCG5517356.1 hypothetical protein [Ectothiorhodospira sp. 9100]MCG5520248.1 hypothetical protein [Ectothiorhodospira sp. 9905]